MSWWDRMRTEPPWNVVMPGATYDLDDAMSQAPTRPGSPGPQPAMPAPGPLVEPVPPRPLVPPRAPARRLVPPRPLAPPRAPARPEPRPARPRPPKPEPRRLLCKARYSAVENRGFGLIEDGTDGRGNQVLIAHGREPFGVVAGDTLAVGAERARVLFTTRHKYYSPGRRVTTLVVGVSSGDWARLRRGGEAKSGDRGGAQVGGGRGSVIPRGHI